MLASGDRSQRVQQRLHTWTRWGWSQPGRDGGQYRYGYQGQEKDPETDWYAFQARQYDGRLGRWFTTDPYRQFFTPYISMANSPLRAVDGDGRLVIFVGGLFSSSSLYSSPWDTWYSSFVNKFKNAVQDYNTVVVTQGFMDPYSRGAAMAKNHLQLFRDAIDRGESLTFAAHSLGGPFTAGMVNALVEEGIDPSKIQVYLIDVADASSHTYPNGIARVSQYANSDSWVTEMAKTLNGQTEMVPDLNLSRFTYNLHFSGQGFWDSHLTWNFNWIFDLGKNSPSKLPVATVNVGKVDCNCYVPK